MRVKRKEARRMKPDVEVPLRRNFKVTNERERGFDWMLTFLHGIRIITPILETPHILRQANSGLEFVREVIIMYPHKLILCIGQL